MAPRTFESPFETRGIKAKMPPLISIPSTTPESSAKQEADEENKPPTPKYLKNLKSDLGPAWKSNEPLRRTRASTRASSCTVNEEPKQHPETPTRGKKVGSGPAAPRKAVKSTPPPKFVARRKVFQPKGELTRTPAKVRTSKSQEMGPQHARPRTPAKARGKDSPAPSPTSDFL